MWLAAALLLTQIGIANSPLEILPEAGTLKLHVGEPMMLRAASSLRRTAVADEAVIEVVAFSQREIALHGKAPGTTNVTFWFADAKREPVTYVVEVAPRK